MRVLHVVPSTPFGGLQKIAALLAAEQRRNVGRACSRLCEGGVAGFARQ